MRRAEGCVARPTLRLEQARERRENKGEDRIIPGQPFQRGRVAVGGVSGTAKEAEKRWRKAKETRVTGGSTMCRFRVEGSYGRGVSMRIKTVKNYTASCC